MVRAAEPAPEAIAPYLDDQVIGVLRVDATRVDVPALRTWLRDTLAAPAAPDADAAAKRQAERAKAAAKDLEQPLAAMEKVLADFRAAGGREAYVLFSTAELLAGQHPPVIIPLGAGADAARIEAIVNGGNPTPADAANAMSARIGNALVVAPPQVRQRLQTAAADKAKAPPSPGVPAALAGGVAAAPDAAVHLAVAMAPDTRRVFEQLAPTLPRELGGGPTSDLTRGLRWATLSVATPPKASVRLTVQASDEAAAGSLEKIARQGLDAFRQMLEGEMKRSTAPEAAKNATRALLDALPKLTPAKQGDKVVLALDQRQIDGLSRVLVAGLSGAREQAVRVQSMSQMRQILMGMHIFRAEQKGQWPADLKTLREKEFVPAPVFDNPAKPGTGYTYLKPPATFRDEQGATRIVLYEDAGGPQGRGVGYADGHVQFMNEDKFREAISAQQEKDKADAGGAAKPK